MALRIIGIFFLIVMLSLFVCVGCAEHTDEAVSNEPALEEVFEVASEDSEVSDVTEVSDEEVEAVEENEVKEYSDEELIELFGEFELEYYYLSQPERLDMTDWNMGALAVDYLNLYEAEFMDKYNREDLMRQGNTVYQINDFPDKSISYNDIDLFTDEEIEEHSIPNIWQTHSATIFGLSYGSGYDGEILGGIYIGMPIDELTNLWGEAQFGNEFLSVRGYKGNLLYIAVIGDEIVERVYIQKYLPLPEECEDFLVLNELCYFASQHKDGHEEYMNKAIQLMNLTADEEPAAISTAASSGGQVDMYSKYGMFYTYTIWEYDYPYFNVSISADYTGKVPKDFSKGAIREMDEAEGQLYRHILWDMWMEKCVDSAVYSPDGTMAYWVEVSPHFLPSYGNRHTVYLFFTDESEPYLEIHCELFEMEKWVDNRYILCNEDSLSLGKGEDKLLDVVTGEIVPYEIE